MLLYSLMPRTVVHRLTRGDEFLKLQSQAGLVETGAVAQDSFLCFLLLSTARLLQNRSMWLWSKPLHVP